MLLQQVWINFIRIGPVPAVSQLLKRQKLNIEDISAIELNEAFSSQVLASINELHLNMDKVNQWDK